MINTRWQTNKHLNFRVELEPSSGCVSAWVDFHKWGQHKSMYLAHLGGFSAPVGFSSLELAKQWLEGQLHA